MVGGSAISVLRSTRRGRSGWSLRGGTGAPATSRVAALGALSAALRGASTLHR
jgi:hypothetical protein